MTAELSNLLYIYKNADFLIKALDDRIELLTEQMQIIEETYAEPSSPLLSDMPKSHEMKDRVAELVEKKEKAISQIVDKITKLKKEKAGIERQYDSIVSAINTLTNKEKQVINLIYKEGKTTDEVVKYAGMKKHSVREYKNKSIRKIQAYLDQKGE